jgi:hypothetical protein
VNRMLSAALIAATMAVVSAPHAHADGTRISITPFQSRQAWQANWDSLNQRGNDAGAQWECHGDHECNLYFIVKPGVKAHLATERYGRGYCYIVDGAPTADCYREDGKKSVWTLDKPFDYGLAPQSPPAPQPAPYVAPQPAPTYVNNDAVPLNVSSFGGLYTKVTLPGYTATMKIDTGADSGSVVTSLADRLIADGVATEAASQTFTNADGHPSTSRMIVIRSVTIGSHTAYNVQVSVVNDGVPMLLGVDALRALHATVDTSANQLTFS